MIDTHTHLDEMDNLETALITAQEVGTKAIIEEKLNTTPSLLIL